MCMYFVFCVWSQILDAFPHPAENDSYEPPTVLSSTQPHTFEQEKKLQDSHVLYKLETTTEVQRKMKQNSVRSVSMIQDFLEPQMEVIMEDYLLPPKTLLRYALILDIVQPTCRRSTCFTKG